MNPEYTGKKIAELRKAKGWTQKDVADRIHVTVSAVSKWERGLNYPDLALLEPLAGALEVTAAELLGLEREKPEQIVIQMTELSHREKERAGKQRRKKRCAAVWSLMGFILAAAAVYLAITEGALTRLLSGSVWLLNLAAVLLGLASWAFSAAEAFSGRWKNRGLFAGWFCCAVSLHLPILIMYLTMRTGDISTAEDVVGAEYFGSAVLLLGTAALQLGSALWRRKRGKKNTESA